jgi:diacylglycerol kinase family enzyme
VQGDGEIIGETPVQVRVVPGAVRLIVPIGQNRELRTESRGRV